jgi:hypothetical protein
MGLAFVNTNKRLYLRYANASIVSFRYLFYEYHEHNKCCMLTFKSRKNTTNFR